MAGGLRGEPPDRRPPQQAGARLVHPNFATTTMSGSWRSSGVATAGTPDHPLVDVQGHESRGQKPPLAWRDRGGAPAGCSTVAPASQTVAARTWTARGPSGLASISKVTRSPPTRRSKSSVRLSPPWKKYSCHRQR